MGELSMSTQEREAFLAAPHVGVLAIGRNEGPPLAVPVWYVYEPGGELWFLTEEQSVKVRLVTEARRFSLCVQNEKPPYAYVSVEGAATIGPADSELHRRPLAHRYLGVEIGDQYVADSVGRPRPIVVSMRPERWWTVDYSKQGNGAY
jgi:PPOX class probable F420-dependent enzyme